MSSAVRTVGGNNRGKLLFVQTGQMFACQRRDMEVYIASRSRPASESHRSVVINELDRSILSSKPICFSEAASYYDIPKKKKGNRQSREWLSSKY